MCIGNHTPTNSPSSISPSYSISHAQWSWLSVDPILSAGTSQPTYSQAPSTSWFEYILLMKISKNIIRYAHHPKSYLRCTPPASVLLCPSSIVPPSPPWWSSLCRPRIRPTRRSCGFWISDFPSGCFAALPMTLFATNRLRCCFMPSRCKIVRNTLGCSSGLDPRNIRTVLIWWSRWNGQLVLVFWTFRSDLSWRLYQVHSLFSRKHFRASLDIGSSFPQCSLVSIPIIVRPTARRAL